TTTRTVANGYLIFSTSTLPWARMRKPAVVPRDTPVDEIDDVLRLTHSVPLARITNHHHRHTDILQCYVELLRLRNRHVVVVLTVHQHHRRLHARDVTQRATLPQRVHQRTHVGVRTKLHGQIVVVVRHVVEADQVRDS